MVQKSKHEEDAQRTHCALTGTTARPWAPFPPFPEPLALSPSGQADEGQKSVCTQLAPRYFTPKWWQHRLSSACRRRPEPPQALEPCRTSVAPTLFHWVWLCWLAQPLPFTATLLVRCDTQALECHHLMSIGERCSFVRGKS